MTFTDSISTCLAKYATFSGRASRSEFWWFQLFCLLMNWGAIIVDPTEIIATLINLAFLIPSLAVGARRLHDIGRTGWWQLIALTVIGLIVLIIFWAKEGRASVNKHGHALTPPSI
ncbi:MAG: DUF805 domain-containing protein [Gammaproteobacteria bacterium]|nr:DUF805 domain-containing protein [Gammaproteobacteria bacterium]